MVVVGDFELTTKELQSIVSSFVSGEPIDDLASRLNLDAGDVLELLNHPEVFEKAIEVRKTMLQLLIYGPLTDRLVVMGSGGFGDARAQVSAIKLLRELAEKQTEEKQKPPPTPSPTNILQVFTDSSGSFDSLVRQVEKLQPKILEASLVES